MPVVPRYDAQVTPGISRATQNIQVSPDTFGAAKGRALQSVSQGLDLVAQRAEQIQSERDDASAREAYVAASSRLRDRMRGENGYLTLNGQAAFDGYNDFAAEVDNIGGEFEHNLSQAARRRFAEMWAPRREGALNSGATHAASQRNAYNVSAAEAVLQERRLELFERRGEVALDPDAATTLIGTLDDAVVALGRLQGAPEGAIALAVQAERSSAILTAITASIQDENVEGAQALFDAQGQHLIGGEAESASEMLRSADQTVRAQRATDELVAQYGTNYDAMRSAARENFEGAIRDDIVSRISLRERENGVRTESTRTQNFIAVRDYLSGVRSEYQQYVEGGSEGDAPLSPEQAFGLLMTGEYAPQVATLNDGMMDLLRAYAYNTAPYSSYEHLNHLNQLEATNPSAFVAERQAVMSGRYVLSPDDTADILQRINTAEAGGRSERIGDWESRLTAEIAHYAGTDEVLAHRIRMAYDNILSEMGGDPTLDVRRDALSAAMTQVSINYVDQGGGIFGRDVERRETVRISDLMGQARGVRGVDLEITHGDAAIPAQHISALLTLAPQFDTAIELGSIGFTDPLFQYPSGGAETGIAQTTVPHLQWLYSQIEARYLTDLDNQRVPEGERQSITALPMSEINRYGYDILRGR